MPTGPSWKEWAALLSPQRLRDLLDAINTQEKVTGSISKPDQFLRRLIINEMDKRYADAESR